MEYESYNWWHLMSTHCVSQTSWASCAPSHPILRQAAGQGAKPPAGARVEAPPRPVRTAAVAVPCRLAFRQGLPYRGVPASRRPSLEVKPTISVFSHMFNCLAEEYCSHA